MKRIGLKSLILLTVVFALVVNAAYLQLFDIRRILGLQPAVLFLIGGLASLASLILSFFLGHRRESPFHLSWGSIHDRPADVYTLLSFRERALWLAKRADERAWELGSLGFLLLAGLGFLVAGLTILENRSLLLLDHFRHNFTKDYAHVCPKEGDSPPLEEQKPEKYGCELVKKAFELGYTKDLGDCAEDQDLADAEVCKDRQWDEPTLHYSFRLVERFTRGFLSSAEELNHSLNREALRKRTAELPELSKSHAQGFIGAPRSSYHIFTDLKEPGGFAGQFRRFLHPNYCQDALRELRFQLAEVGRDPGYQLEDALGHLLFNPAVGNGSDHCRPYTIHWEAAPTTCGDIMANGNAALSKLGIADTIDTVLERQRLEKAYSHKSLPEESKEKQKAKISFHCLMTQPSPPTTGTVKIGEQNFAVSSASLPAAADNGLMPNQSLMQAVASSFAPGFTYTNLDRKMPIVIDEKRFRQEIARSGRSLQLSKLELLRFSDVLAGDLWLEHYPEYMEVYPWQPHLSNFVGRFRRAYHREDQEK